jgi:hypothetical protein
LLGLILLLIAAILIIAATIFLIRGISRRRGVSGHIYGVARTEARKDMIVSIAQSVFFLFLGLIVIIIYGLVSRAESPNGTPTHQSPTAPTSTLTAFSSPVIEQTRLFTPAPTILMEPPASSTAPVVPPTATSSPTPVPTVTPKAPSAIVNSPNGLWLRETPGGTEELELIPDGTELFLEDGLEAVDDLEWQLVTTPSNNLGWVAIEFIIYQ